MGEGSSYKRVWNSTDISQRTVFSASETEQPRFGNNMIALKCISAVAVLSVVSAGHSAQQYNTGGFINTGNPGPYNSAYSGNYGGAHIPILSYENVNNGDGTYRYSYETGNGISAHESGAPRAQGPEGPAVTADGGFSYTAPDGQKISLAYTADENGFHPTGSHIPTPPPIPEAILRSLEFNRQNPSSGAGSYNGGHHGHYNY